jgi:hypothetical protein
MVVMVPNAFLANVQKVNYHNAQLVQLLDLRLWD